MDRIKLTPEDLSALIGLVYDSAFEEVQWKSLIDRIAALFPGVGSVVYGIEGEMLLPEYTTSHRDIQVFTEPVRMDFGLLDGKSAREVLASLPNGFLSRTRKFIAEEDYLKSGIYRNVLKPLGFRHAIHLKLDGRGTRNGVIGFALPDDAAREARLHDPLFDLLKLLSPHVVRAMHLARALALAKQATAVFSGFLDGIILPMLVTDAGGKYLFGNAAGRRVLDRGAPLGLGRDGRLTLEDAGDRAALLRKIGDVDRDMVPGGLRIWCEPEPMLLSITPFRASMREASAIDRHLLSEERLFAVFIGQTERDAISTTLLEDVFDLTAREAEVCKALMLGASAAEIAEGAERSLKTVRNQIQIIYEKVGVSSNVALMEALSVFRTVGAMFEEDGGGVTALE